MLNITQIPAPRVDLIDPKTGLMSREWFRFFNNIYTIVGANLGVIQIENGGTGLSTYPTNGQLLIGDTTTGAYVLNTLSAALGISVTNGAGTITLSNTGVLSNVGGLGISVSSATGDVTITNTGVLSTIAGTGISVSSATGDVTIANTGVLSVSGTAPVVSSGGATPAISLASGYGDTQNPYASKTANYVLASPDGAAGVPTFRALVAADIPSLSGTYIPYTGASSAVDLNAKTLVNVANLGINTTTVPNIRLRAVGDNGTFSRITMRGYSSDANSSSMRVSKFRGSTGAPQAPISGDSLGKFELAGYGTTAAEAYPQVSLEGVTTEIWTAIARGAKALIKVTPNTTITQVTAVTVDQDSKVTLAGALAVTGHTTFEGITSTGATGTGKLVYDTSPTLVTPLLGTPTSGVVTNLTGTASININGTVGATTPTTGVFTTATANSFIPNLSTIPTNGMYLPATNSVGIATNSTNRATFDAAGNVGIATTPAAWASFSRVIQLGLGAYSQGRTGNGSIHEIGANSYLNTSSVKTYITSQFASYYEQNGGTHSWYVAPSGTAGDPITFTLGAIINNSGNLSVGTTAALAKLTTTGFSVVDTGSVGYQVQINSAANLSTISAYSTTGQALALKSTTAAGASNEVMRLSLNGGVSIGNTVDPGLANLSVTGTGKYGTTISVGASTPSASGAGITFPATQSASTDVNTLDDYEEGTWTPADGSGAGLTFTSITANYTKIGNVVNVFTVLTYPATIDVSQAKISGLPFNAGTFAQALFLAPANTNATGQGLASASTAIFLLYTQNGAVKTNVNMTGATIYLTGTYTV